MKTIIAATTELERDELKLKCLEYVTRVASLQEAIQKNSIQLQTQSASAPVAATPGTSTPNNVSAVEILTKTAIIAGAGAQKANLHSIFLSCPLG
jgi:hypothetical protein